jgi:hypothetical protein
VDVAWKPVLRLGGSPGNLSLIYLKIFDLNWKSSLGLCIPHKLPKKHRGQMAFNTCLERNRASSTGELSLDVLT